LPPTGDVPECFLLHGSLSAECRECSSSLFLPPGGVQRCVVRFEMPLSISSGVLHFNNGTHSDSDPFLF
jgi:hypothetical protein